MKWNKLESLNQMVRDMMRETHTTCENFKKIALKSNPWSEVEYIDFLIESEKNKSRKMVT